MIKSNTPLPLFAKLHKVNFLFDRISDRKLQDTFSITLTQYHILISLQIGPCSQSDIARYWGVSKPAVSRQVEELRTKELLTRETNPSNRREDIITATDVGQTLFMQATSLLEDMFNTLTQNMASKEKDSLEKSLEMLLATLKEQANRKIIVKGVDNHEQ